MATSLGALIVVLDFTGVSREEFDAWYDTEHIPERQRVPGFRSAQRWLSADGNPLSFAIYDLDALEVLSSAPYRAIAGDNLSPWSKRMIGSCKRIWRFEADQVSPGDQISPEGAGGLLLFAMNVEPGAEVEFNEWYDVEHMPRFSKVPGVLAARRFRVLRGNQKYLAVYHLRAPEVVESKGWTDAVETPWTIKMRMRTNNRLRMVFAAYQPVQAA